jgi:amino acid transporter
VIAFERAGIPALPSIINAVVCTSAFSSGSACIFLASRTLYGLSQEGQAPKFFQKCNRFGTPYLAVAASLLLIPLVYLSVASTPSIVFGWLVNITTVSGFISWIAIKATYVRFYHAMKAPGDSRADLPYKSPLQPFTAWFTMISIVVVILFSGIHYGTSYSACLNTNLTPRIQRLLPKPVHRIRLLSNYINIPIFLGT